ncbi:hypothetical protein M427DRAFT_337757 [Gonapodya prolifera JEL478]|uniref:BTB domain-containing protein n=1 Tax=Gonapodya prolifera (strain JEL478) TaxID=1344416 RepID=A0A139AD76_GONPJ|nr:hypothetical protein M427DRAFT_337757 [Gonapodya prolifera JEL478]|eukprot:KXS14751.1 hypothetical protein M427DRAFT_337757 [Gonapodya prolifera JEL478]
MMGDSPMSPQLDAADVVQNGGPQQPALTAFLPYLKAAKYADAVLKIKTTDNKINTVPVHRVLLSYRSPFFEDLFSQTLPTETNSKGLPMYPLPVLPSHKALHEVLGLSLWWIYSMEDNEISIPESKWDQIVGVRHVAEIFELPRLHSYSDRVLKTSIENPTSTPDDIFTIADEAAKWGVRDIENLAIDRLVDLLASPATDDDTLAVTSFTTFSAILDHTDPTKHFALVRRYVAARSRPHLVLPSDQSAALWNRVPFDALGVEDIENAFVDNNVPISLVLDAASSKIATDSHALLRASFDLFFATVDHATADVLDAEPSHLFVPWPANQTYQMVRAYVHANPDLDGGQREDLWSKVRLEDLTLDELEEANRDGSAPRNALVTALFAKLRTPGAGGPSSFMVGSFGGGGGGGGGSGGPPSLQSRPSVASFPRGLPPTPQSHQGSSSSSMSRLPPSISSGGGSQGGPYTLGPQPVIDTQLGVDLPWATPGQVGGLDNSDAQSVGTVPVPLSPPASMGGASGGGAGAVNGGGSNGNGAAAPPPTTSGKAVSVSGKKGAGIQRFLRESLIG